MGKMRMLVGMDGSKNALRAVEMVALRANKIRGLGDSAARWSR